MAINYCELSKKLLDALGHVIREIDCDHSCNHSDGIVLSYGDHVIEVETGVRPKHVYVSLEDQGSPICIGDVSTSGVVIDDRGFTLYVHVKTNSTLVSWIMTEE